MNMELLIRQGSDPRTWRHTSRGADDRGIRVKITHAWFEGPNDMHIHISGHQETPLCPLHCESTGDYVIPNPTGKGFVRCYSIMLLSGNKRVAPLPDADEKYVRRLLKTWDSPCGPKRPKKFADTLSMFMTFLKQNIR